MDAGDFVPDRVTNKMVRDRLGESDVGDGFLLDGYPHTMAQVEYLDEILVIGGQSLDVVLQLTADDQELVTRLLGRARETGRSDDNEAVIRHRLDLYHEQSETVAANYAESGILTQVDGIGGIDEVTDRVMRAILHLLPHSSQFTAR
jgi:adenylate kinase